MPSFKTILRISMIALSAVAVAQRVPAVRRVVYGQ